MGIGRSIISSIGEETASNRELVTVVVPLVTYAEIASVVKSPISICSVSVSL